MLINLDLDTMKVYNLKNVFNQFYYKTQEVVC